jgi:hypothetical protein
MVTGAALARPFAPEAHVEPARQATALRLSGRYQHYACLARAGRSRTDRARRLTNGNDILHGGAIMTLADNLGGTATMRTAAGFITTTIESKTNSSPP